MISFIINVQNINVYSNDVAIKYSSEFGSPITLKLGNASNQSEKVNN